MSISFLSCPISKIHNHTIIRAGLLEAVGIARGWGGGCCKEQSSMHCGRGTLWHLSGERGGDELEMVVWGSIVHWHLTAVSQVMVVAKTLMNHLIQSEATPQEDTCGTVREAVRRGGGGGEGGRGL